METIDCRGMSCPQPVLETKKALEKPDTQEVLVLIDNPGSKENVRRFAESQGCKVKIVEERGGFALRIQKEKAARGENKVGVKGILADGSVVLFIDSDSLGRGSEELGRILMRSFIHTLGEANINPHKIIFINSGVKLACEGSEVLEDLTRLSLLGVEILSCGTCLDYYGQKEKIRVGRISNMFEILQSLAQAGKVLKV